MPGLRQDYILTQIDLLRRFVARLANKREEAGLEEALQLAFNLQEKLFQMSPSVFLRRDVAQQIESLMAGETKVDGAGKCLTYAQLLKETATLYQIRGRDDLAAGARQLALHVALSVAVAEPASSEKFKPLINELDSLVDHENLHPPVVELLNAYQRV
ncbi:MAG TPA: hypothetical protein VGM64_06300 [Lacunisphaera sp.]|jgi:hypothetical protein